MAVDQRLLKAWPGFGCMLVAAVHLHRPIAGFQLLTVANISIHSHGSGDDAAVLDSFKAAAFEI
eukprot:11164836-Lingulodinium_polyedra.AAC.1